MSSQSEPWRLTTPEKAWAVEVLPSLLEQRAAIQAAGRQPYRVLVDFDTVPNLRLKGGTILGLPLIHSPGMVEPTVAP